MQENIDDIVAEIRRLNPEKFLSTPWYCEAIPNKMRSYADLIEANVADIIAENARLKSDISELLKCLQKIYDEECTGFGTGDVFNRISQKMNGGAK